MTPQDSATMQKQSRDFVRTIIDEDLASGKHTKVITRFPPEPNGFLHIGHAKSICLNFGLAVEYGQKLGVGNAKCHLRMDDTDPTKEDMLYVAAIQEDVKWLGFDWGDNLFFASDYFDKLYNFAVKLIKEEKAYVCSLNEEEIREYRGTVTSAGKNSPYRTRSIEENLDLFERMKAGEFNDGDHVLRAKIDMASPNMKMRDPLLYRIRGNVSHYRVKDKWKIYPLYDFTHCISDALEGITHSICTLEFENNRELYDWILDQLDIQPVNPKQYEFARLNINYTVMSKRKLLQLVDENYVRGWDDPRMLTISGLRRRGVTPEAIRKFCDTIGLAKANSVVDMAQLEYCIRDDLNFKAPRVMAVLDPVKVIITNYPEDKTEMLDADYYPHDVPKDGSRELPFSREIFIEQDDFNENPPKGYYRLTPGGEVRLRHAYIIKCNNVIKGADGNIKELHCTYDENTPLGESPTNRKIKGTIHWVSAPHCFNTPVRLYDRLFMHEKPDGDKDVDFKTYINPESLIEKPNAVLEPSLKEAKAGEHFQFERQGYFFVDPVNADSGQIVFNRVVTLKDSWSSSTKPEQPSAKADKQKAEKKKPVHVEKSDDEKLAELSEEHQKRLSILQDEFKLSFDDAVLLSESDELTEYYRSAVNGYNNPQAVANLINNELLRVLKETPLAELPFGPIAIAQLVEMLDNDTITSTASKIVFEEMCLSGKAPNIIVEEKSLKQINDPETLSEIIEGIIANNPDNVAKYRDGKKNLLGFFIGQVLKATNGSANPKLTQELVQKKLDN